MIDPWGVEDIDDYTRLFAEFGISRFRELLHRIEKPHLYMRRGIIFGHRGYEEVLRAMEEKRIFSVMSGFMPSGRVHLGSKMVMDEIIWHQQMGGDAFACIADMESHSVRGLSWRKCKEIGINEYLLSLVALGFEIGYEDEGKSERESGKKGHGHEHGYIYFQSENQRLQNLAFELGNEVNVSEISAIYGFSGDVSISHMMSVLMQNADILQPQLSEYEGPKPVVIPVGVDQDPHIRLTRDIASRMRMFRVEKREDKNQNTYISIREKKANKEALREIGSRIEYPQKNYEMHMDVYGIEEGDIDRELNKIEQIVREVEIEFGGYGFFLPASSYHRFMHGITGGKMSSSNPESYISLTEPPGEAAEKVKTAKTGGRATIEEQRKLGGLPEECAVYELMMFHLIEDDAYIMEIFEECKNGKRSCNSCKKLASELMFSFIKKHQEERENAKEVLKEHGIGKRWIKEN